MDRPGSRTPISWVQTRHLPIGRAAHFPFAKGPPVTRSSALPQRCAAETPADQLVIPDGVEPSSPARHAGVVAVGPRDRGVQCPVLRVQSKSHCESVRNETCSRLGTLNSQLAVTSVGVEPTKSPRPQRDRFACLRSWSCAVDLLIR